MNHQQMKQTPASDQLDQSVQTPLEKLAMQFPHLTEKQLKVRAWALRSPGERIEIEDDDVAFEEG